MTVGESLLVLFSSALMLSFLQELSNGPDCCLEIRTWEGPLESYSFSAALGRSILLPNLAVIDAVGEGVIKKLDRYAPVRFQ